MHGVSIDRLAEARERFETCYGHEASWGARAPGRINWIGEHTDYEEGLVLPSAIDRDTWVLVAPGEGARVEVHSEAFGDAAFDAAAPRRRGGWIDYIQGVAWALGEQGFAMPDARVWIDSRVPAGAGLSSSAALCVAVTLAFERRLGVDLGAETRVRVAHQAESAFVGTGCGVLDPMASVLGRRGAALRIDCRDGSAREVHFPESAVTMLVAESGVTRSLADGGYRARVDECRALFRTALDAGCVAADARTLRDLPPSALRDLEARVGPTLARRARHVVTENQRVDRAAEALSRGAWSKLGEVLREGHASLRDDYEVSVPELDTLCEVADAEPGCFGSRLIGAGWGGCTLHVVAADVAESVMAALSEGFQARFGRRPAVHALAAADGARPLF